MTHLGELLRLYRTARQITSRELAAAIDLDVSSLARLERGEPSSADALLKLRKWLLEPVKADELLRKR